MARSVRSTRILLALAVVLPWGCDKSGESTPARPADAPADDEGDESADFLPPSTIIIRSVRPPDDPGPGPRAPAGAYGLKWRDYERFETIGEVVERLVPVHVQPQEIRSLDRAHKGRVIATTRDFPEVKRLVVDNGRSLTRVEQVEVKSGRFLTEDDDREMRNVVVLGARVADKLFPYDNPLDHSVRIGHSTYRVVGVLREHFGPPGGVRAAGGYNDDVFLPIRTFRRKIGDVALHGAGGRNRESVELHEIIVSVSDAGKTAEVVEAFRKLLNETHTARDWEVVSP